MYARSVCDTKAPLQLRYAACGAMKVLYAFAFCSVTYLKHARIQLISISMVCMHE